MKTSPLFLAVTLFAAPTLHAQLVPDGTTNTLSNVTNTITGDVTVGTNGSFTLLILSDNALLTNSVNGLIGRNATAKSNEVQLISASARWRMGGSLFVGSNGSLSRLVVSNGGFVESLNGRLSFAGAAGNQTVSSNNFALVTGGGSLWSNRSDLTVGGSGRHNQMVVSNGGWVVSRTARVGENPSASNNLALITGSGSVWSNALDLRIGVLGSGNRLVIESGGWVYCDTGIIGDFSSGSNNEAVVTGLGSLWTNRTALLVGNQIGRNRLVVSNGAMAWSASGFVGNTTAADNQAIVTGAGSLWNNPGSLTVGDFGGGNVLIVSNGATVLAGNLFVGANSGLANRVMVDGGTLRVTNVAGTSVLDVRRGTNVLNAGLIEVDQLLLTNLAGRFEFNGGTVAVKNSTTANQQPFRVGDGVNPAMFMLLDNGVHTFVNGLTIAANATLSGHGTIGAMTTILSGGTLGPGVSIGKIVLGFPPLLQGAVLMEISKNGAAVTNDQIQVTGTLTYGGSLTVTNIGTNALAAGDSLQLFNAAMYNGSFAAISLPPLPSPLDWENNLLADGSIQVLDATPAVSTLPATDLTGTNATLNGVGNPEGRSTTVWFEWGTTTNYGNVTSPQALGGGTNNSNFNQIISGVPPSVTHHFRAVASNKFAVVFGNDQSLRIVFKDIGIGLPGVDSAQPSIVLGGLEFAYTNNGSSGFVAWGDYDNDGWLDILLAGSGISQVWRNTGTGFTNSNAALSLVPLVGCSVAWGDYDNDERLDFAITGIFPHNGFDSESVAGVYHNTGNGFINTNTNPSARVLGSHSGAVAWGDYDNDGLLDILSTGILSDAGTEYFLTAVWRTIGSGWSNINVFLTPLFNSSAAWGDYDNDGRLDILVAGDLSTSSEIWRNTGQGFTNISAGLTRASFGSVAWGDYDNDGRLDILLTGTTDRMAGGAVSQVWRNTGSGFTNIDAGLPPVFRSSAAWGDYDNDGRLDILLTGTTDGTAAGAITEVWRNTGSGFTNANLGLPGVFRSSVAWGDYDNDGRLDLLIAGTNATLGRISQVWRNHTPLTNTPPSAPTSLAATAVGNQVILSWNAANDAQTPDNGLTYNVRIGSTPGASDLMGPMSSSSGLRRLPQMGNVQRRLVATFTPILGKPYYWSVQAVDTAFAGGPFAPEQSFTINTVFTPTNGIPVPGDLNGDGIMSQSELAAALTNLNGTGIVTESDLDLILSYYFPNSPFLQLTNVAGLGGTNVTFALTNSLAGAFSVEYTTNLVDWYFLGPATPRYLFTDTNAPALSQRYYRLRWP